MSTLDQALAQAELFRQYPEALYPREAEIIVLADEVLRQREEIEELKVYRVMAQVLLVAIIVQSIVMLVI